MPYLVTTNVYTPLSAPLDLYAATCAVPSPIIVALPPERLTTLEPYKIVKEEPVMKKSLPTVVRIVVSIGVMIEPPIVVDSA